MSQYPHLYNSKAWKARRADQLAQSPLCVFCDRMGIVREATVCDHIEPHRGDEEAFYYGDLQSLCKPCHDGLKQSEEKSGYSKQIGRDGWPIDPKHPVNGG